MSATVIIPTTGSPELRDAIESVLNQTYEDTTCYLVCDGEQSREKVIEIFCKFEKTDRLVLADIPLNVGANGFYGHRIYAAFTHLVNSKYVLYLDQDNWFEPNHVQSCINTIEQKNLDWCYSLRKINDKQGNFVCNDDCESLGKWPIFKGLVHAGEYHIDTNCYCLKTEVAIRLCQVWHGGWGQDRVFLSAMTKHVPNFDCTGEYTVDYRVDGNGGSVQKEFFLYGNAIMNEKYNGVFPWRKVI